MERMTRLERVFSPYTLVPPSPGAIGGALIVTGVDFGQLVVQALERADAFEERRPFTPRYISPFGVPPPAPPPTYAPPTPSPGCRPSASTLTDTTLPPCAPSAASRSTSPALNDASNIAPEHREPMAEPDPDAPFESRVPIQPQRTSSNPSPPPRLPDTPSKSAAKLHQKLKRQRKRATPATSDMTRRVVALQMRDGMVRKHSAPRFIKAELLGCKLPHAQGWEARPAGPLFRWVAYGFRTKCLLAVQDPAMKRRLDSERSTRWARAQTLFSKYDSLEADIRKAFDIPSLITPEPSPGRHVATQSESVSNTIMYTGVNPTLGFQLIVPLRARSTHPFILFATMPPTIIYNVNTTYYINGVPSGLHAPSTATPPHPIIVYTMTTTTTTTTDSAVEVPASEGVELALPNGFLGHHAATTAPGAVSSISPPSVANSPLTPIHTFSPPPSSLPFGPDASKTAALAEQEPGGVWESVLPSGPGYLVPTVPSTLAPPTPPPTPTIANIMHGIAHEAPMTPLDNFAHLAVLTDGVAEADLNMARNIGVWGRVVSKGSQWRAMVAQVLDRVDGRLPISRSNLLLSLLVIAAFLY
ncbi:hypothetical protein BV25DRAFT_1915378 [Artomyces pyxidatus]|uniref:Uncharacterized protein n=1 Tax=Artomyces pyxidatus TaxID=48021 RepID=A0ACB8T2Y3_9AGAM|nr:hypothetical protein BV25DRAFT_1915378 [Artomyces pyxidatus]